MNLYGYEIFREKDLLHYGVKGMQWGVINEDESNGKDALTSVFNMMDKQLASNPSAFNPDLFSSQPKLFRSALAQYGRVNVARFTDDQLDFLMKKYLTKREDDKTLTPLFSAVDKYLKENPNANPADMASSNDAFRKTLKEYAGIDTTEMLDRDIARLRKKFLDHYSGYSVSEDAPTSSSSGSYSGQGKQEPPKEKEKEEPKKRTASTSKAADPWDLALAKSRIGYTKMSELEKNK